MDSGTTLTFIIVSFALALVVIMKRESIPMPARRYLSLFAIVAVAFSFFLIVYSFLHR
jgi:hypothetical protein